MKCPPEIELNEFAEDRLESRRRWEIQEHLDQCTGCRTDLEGLQWVGGPLDLLAEAEAMDHPSDADLAALAEGSIDADRKAELLSHLGTCAECARLFGALPRPQRKSVIPRNLYSFAAAAALLVCLGVFAFTGKFADHKPGLAPVVAQHGSGQTDAQKFATKPPVKKTEKPSGKKTEVAAVKPIVAAKPTPKPVAPAKVSPSAPAPTMVARVTPKVRVAAATPSVHRAVSKPVGTGRSLHASRAHRTRSKRTGRSGYHNTQVAMATPQDLTRAVRGEAATHEGTTGTDDKALATSPSSPSKPAAPGGAMGAMAATTPDKRGVVPPLPAPVKPTPGAAPGDGHPQAMQKSQTLPVMIAQSRNDLAKKTQVKAAGRHLVAGAGKLAGQKPRGEVTKNSHAKASLKSLASKSTHRSSHPSAKVARSPHAPASGRSAPAQSTGAHAHPGSPHV